MTRSMVTGACGIAGKSGKEKEKRGEEELASPDGELSKIDDLIFLSFFPLFSPFSLSLLLQRTKLRYNFGNCILMGAC